MKLFITGATGYIGYKLAMDAAQRGWAVNALIRDTASKYRPVHEKISLFKGDITDKASIENAMRGCDHVFHTAAFTYETLRSSPDFFAINVQGTRNMLDVALANKVTRFVFTGSCSIYGSSDLSSFNETNETLIDPTTLYSASKYEAEKIVKEYCRKGLSTTILRPSRIYGPGHLTNGNPITKLILNVLRKRIAFMPADARLTDSVGQGSMIGNYVFIDDVVNAHFLALEKTLIGQEYDIGGENISYHNFFQTLKKLSQKNFLIVPVSKKTFKVGSGLYNAFNNLFGTNRYISPGLVNRIWQNRAVSSEKAITELGYTVTGFDEGMLKTINFLKNIDHH